MKLKGVDVPGQVFVNALVELVTSRTRHVFYIGGVDGSRHGRWSNATDESRRLRPRDLAHGVNLADVVTLDLDKSVVIREPRTTGDMDGKYSSSSRNKL